MDLDNTSIDELPWMIRNPSDYFDTVTDVQKNHKRGAMEYQESRLKEIGAGFYVVCLKNNRIDC